MTKDVGDKKTKLTELNEMEQPSIALRQKMSKYILHIQVKKSTS